MLRPIRQEANDLDKVIRHFTAQWVLNVADQRPIDVQWLDYVAKFDEDAGNHALKRRRLDWLGFCILGAYSGSELPRREIRKHIMSHMKRCLGKW